MHTLRLITVGLAAAATTAALVATPDPSRTSPRTVVSTGTGQIFMVNPVQSSGDQEPDRQPRTRTPPSWPRSTPLPSCATSTAPGRCTVDWVHVKSSTGTPATARPTRSSTPVTRTSSSRSWATSGSTRRRSTSSPSASARRPATARSWPGPYELRINQYGADNSFMDPDKDYIRLGKGGVDDAEDAEVIMHEYGHAIHADQVPGFYGTDSIDAGAIGESFGDYFAVSTGLAAAKQYGWPVNAEEACPMDWDATSYTNAPHCIRRFDLEPDRWPTVATRCTTTARSGARRSGRSAGLRRAGIEPRGLGHHADQLAVQLRPGHVLPGRRRGDVRRGARPRRREVRHHRQGRVRPPRHHVLTRPLARRHHDAPGPGL